MQFFPNQLRAIKNYNSMIKLTHEDWRMFRRLQRKHNVSTEFLRYNLLNIQKFIWYETWPRIIIKRYAIRRGNRVFLEYYRLRRVLFDVAHRKLFKRMRQNIKQWSKRMVQYNKRIYGIDEYVEEIVYDTNKAAVASQATTTAVSATSADTSSGDDVIQKLKEQLELLKSRRQPSLMISKDAATAATSADKAGKGESNEETIKSSDIPVVCDSISANKKTAVEADPAAISKELTPIASEINELQSHLESTPERPTTEQKNVQPSKQQNVEAQENSETAEDLMQQSSCSQQQQQQPSSEPKSSLNFLDMLMCKVNKSKNEALSKEGKEMNNVSSSSSSTTTTNTTSTVDQLKNKTTNLDHEQEHSMDSNDGFLGFDDSERLPGMLLTPVVPNSTKKSSNSIFISETLNEYMRVNDLETDFGINKYKTEVINRRDIVRRDLEGLVTVNAKLPPLDMPAVPDNLGKYRTVAERKQYLQKFSKNSRLSIINNELSIYRELQKKLRIQKQKSASQQVAQSASSSMSFTRNGWHAASFVNTEFNKYYYQMLDVDNGEYQLTLKGVRGNNKIFRKTPYISKVQPSSSTTKCWPSQYCLDHEILQSLKPIVVVHKTPPKLNNKPLYTADFKPCPLSRKPLQKPLDEDAVSLLLCGGSMAVVRMPTVELEVFPENGKSLHEIAKRYLQYILPHHDISREWAEFSVSTLLQSSNMREAEKAAAIHLKSLDDQRKSYTFVIPYHNDRNHVLVRRVVDRSEKLDESFETLCSASDTELQPKTDLTFRKDISEQTDDQVLLDCADVVSDIINAVAISCSENSFIKPDPDSLQNNDDEDCDGGWPLNNNAAAKSLKHDKEKSSSSSAVGAVNGNSNGSGSNGRKQKSLLMELKRLNATIIDAAVKHEKDKPCTRDHCRLGCICSSLIDDPPIKEHCGKAKCMLECTCKGSTTGRIMRLETDGRSITTEDAFMLRRKATARLARMEKEFTSTIVLTENETLLINETNNDKKRRCTKAPKRYEDFANSDDEELKRGITLPTKKTAMTTIDNENSMAIEIKEILEPVYVKNSILEQMKHCTVNLTPLQDVDNMVAWCMVHNLYKCFCKARAVEGKPVVIEKEEMNTTIEHSSDADVQVLGKTVSSGPAAGKPKLQQWSEIQYTTKAKYTFDKVEKRKKSLDDEASNEDGGGADDDENDNEENDSDDEHEDNDWHKERQKKKSSNAVANKRKLTQDSVGQPQQQGTGIKDRNSLRRKESAQNRSYSEAAEEDELQEHEIAIAKGKDEPVPEEDPLSEENKARSNDKTKPAKRSLQEVRARFLEPRPEMCRRQIPIPRRMFLYCNRKRHSEVLEYIRKTENEQTRLLLSEHIMRSVYYHKVDSERNQKAKPETEKQAIKINSNNNDNVVSSKVNDATNAGVLAPTKAAPVQPKSDIKEVIDLLEDEEDKKQEETVMSDHDAVSSRRCSSSSSIGPSSQKRLKLSDEKLDAMPADITDDKVDSNEKKPATISVKNFATLSSSNTESALAPTKLPSMEADAMKLKISNCFSLNAKANMTPAATCVAAEHNADFTSATTLMDTQEQANKTAQHNNREGRNHYNNMLEGAASVPMPLQHLSPAEGEQVKEAYNNVIKSMNSLVSKKMQDIDMALKRESHIIPSPNADILCIMKWVNFLDAFCEGYVYIWQVKTREVSYFVATVRNMMPMIIGALGVVNIAALKADKIPLMGRMLLLRMRTPETQKLAIVMQGKETYWIVKGFLKADPDMACNKPTPDTHPTLTKKINVLCSLLVKQKQKEEKKKLPKSAEILHTTKVAQILPTPRVAAIGNSPTVNMPPTKSYFEQQQHPVNKQTAKNNSVATPPPPPTATATLPATQKSRKRKVENIQPCSSPLLTNNSSSSSTTTNTKNSLINKMDTYAAMKSNIEFRRVNQTDIQEIYLPEIRKMDHKWLVLDLQNDFSHIFVPEFRDLVSLDRIQKVMQFAKQKSKIVKLQFFQNAPFDAFVTPKSGRKIYFGPLSLDMKPPTLILLQSVDGQMMLRELYQMKHKISKKPEEVTRSFWLLQMQDGQTHFELDVTPTTGGAVVTLDDNDSQQTTREMPTMPAQSIVLASADNNDDDNDDDCMIVDDDHSTKNQNTETAGHEQAERFNFTIQSNINNSNKITITPQISISQTGSSSSSSTMTTQQANTTQQSMNTNQVIIKIPNTNTFIKPLATSVIPTTSLSAAAVSTRPSVAGIPSIPAASVAVSTRPSAAGISSIPAASVAVSTRPSPAGIPSIPAASAAIRNSLLSMPSCSSRKIVNTPNTIISSSASSFPLPTNTCQSGILPSVETPAITATSSLSASNSKRRRISEQNPSTAAEPKSMANSVCIGSTTITKFPEVTVTAVRTTAATTAAAAATTTSTVSKLAISQQQQQQLPLVFDVNPMVTTTTMTTTTMKPSTFITTKVTLPLPTTTSISNTLQQNPVVATSNNLQSSPIQRTYKVIKLPGKTCLNVAQKMLPASVVATQKTTKIMPVGSKSVQNTISSQSVVTQQTQKIIPAQSVAAKQAQHSPKIITAQSAATHQQQSQLKNSLSNTSNTSAVVSHSTPTISSSSLYNSFSVKNVTTTSKPTLAAAAAAVASSSASSTSSLSNSIKITTTVGGAVIKASSSSSNTGNIVPQPKFNVIPSKALISSSQTLQSTTPPSSSSINMNSTKTVNKQQQQQLSISKVQSLNASSAFKKQNPQNLPAAIQQPRQQFILPAAREIGGDGRNITSNSTTLIQSKPQQHQQKLPSPMNSSLQQQQQQHHQKQPSPMNSSLQQQQYQQKPSSPMNSPSIELLDGPPPHIQYGYIVSTVYTDHKFVAKRVTDEFYVKVPSVGILRLQGEQGLNNHLNKYLLKMNKTVTGVWKFVAASKAVQLQNHHKSLMVRQSKVQNKSNNESTIPISLSSPSSSLERSAMESSSADETILIDD